MRKFIFFIVVLISIGSISNAQFKFNRSRYDYRMYVYRAGDPYNPGFAGVCSALIPGLGQMFSGETGRGLAFLGADLGFSLMYAVGSENTSKSILIGNNVNDGTGLMTVGLLGMLVVDIWAIVDAVRVAKVNDLAFRDRYRFISNFKIRPFVSGTNNYRTEKIVSGVCLKITF